MAARFQEQPASGRMRSQSEYHIEVPEKPRRRSFWNWMKALKDAQALENRRGPPRTTSLADDKPAVADVWSQTGKAHFFSQMLYLLRNLQACCDAIRRNSTFAKSEQGQMWISVLDSSIKMIQQMRTRLQTRLKELLNRHLSIPSENDDQISKALAKEFDNTRRLYADFIRKIGDCELEVSEEYMAGVTNGETIDLLLKESNQAIDKIMNDWIAQLNA